MTRRTYGVVCVSLAWFAGLTLTGGARAQAPTSDAPPPVTLRAADDELRRPATAQFLSREGSLAYLGIGVVLPLLTDGRNGTNHSLRALDALGTSALLSAGLKALTREKRPDTNERNSFPSGHATAAFAVAVMQSAFHPRQAGFWYAGAVLIADSRVRLHRHHPQDVLAGAALGYLTARWELSRPRGLILSPVLRPAGENGPRRVRGGFGLQFTGRF